MEEPQSPERLQLVIQFAEALRNLEDGCPNHTQFGTARAPSEYQRCAPCGMKLHLTARVPIGSVPESGERSLDTASAFLHQRQLHPQRHCGGRQRHPDRYVTMRAKRPSRAPRAGCRSGGRNRPPMRPSAVSPTRFRPARRDRGNIPRDAARAVRVPHSRRAFRAHRPASCRATGSARRGRQPPPRQATSRPDWQDPRRLADGAISVLATTALAASRPKAPAKIARRRRITRSGSLSSS